MSATSTVDLSMSVKQTSEKRIQLSLWQTRAFCILSSSSSSFSSPSSVREKPKASLHLPVTSLSNSSSCSWCLGTFLRNHCRTRENFDLLKRSCAQGPLEVLCLSVGSGLFEETSWFCPLLVQVVLSFL